MEPIAELLVKQACLEVVTSYARAVNDWDIDAFVDHFTPDGVWRRPGDHVMAGHDQIRAFMDSQPVPGPDRTVRHVNGGVDVDVIDGDHAAVWSQTTVYDGAGTDVLPAPMDGPTLIVEYRDQMVRTDDGWRLRERNTTVVFASHD